MRFGLGALLRSPPDDNANGGTGDDDKSGDQGDKGGGAGDGDKGGTSDKLKGAGGLLGTRKQADDKGSDQNADADKGDKGDKPGADGRPAHIPEKFWDAKTKTVKHDDMAKAYSALERNFGDLKRSKSLGGEVPEKPEEYFGDQPLKLEGAERFGSEVAPDDPGLKSWGKIAHKYGVGKETAVAIAKDMFKEMNASAPEPIDLEAERAALGDGADEQIDGVFLWADKMEREGKFGGDDIDHVIDLSSTASGIRFLAKVRGMSGERPIPLGLPTGNRGMSQEEWHSAMRDAVKAKDYKKQGELDAISGAIFGTEAASGSPIGGIPNQKDVDRSARK